MKSKECVFLGYNSEETPTGCDTKLHRWSFLLFKNFNSQLRNGKKSISGIASWDGSQKTRRSLYRKWHLHFNKIRFFRLFSAVEADDEMKESETSRGLTDEEKKESPSHIMSVLDKGFSAIANLVTDEVNV